MKTTISLSLDSFNPCLNVRGTDYELEAYSQIMALNMEAIQLLESFQKELNRRVGSPQPQRVFRLLDKANVQLVPAEPQLLITEVGDRLGLNLKIQLSNKRFLPVVDHELLVEGLIYLLHASDYLEDVCLSFMADHQEALIILENITDIRLMEEELSIMEQVMQLIGGELTHEYNSIVLSFHAEDKFH